MLISWMFVKCLKKSLRKKMLWQYRCGSPCEMKFISVVCGLAAIQKQPRLVDRAFNRASPSHFPEPAFQALLQTSVSPPVSHFWLLPFPPTHSSALSLFPNPVSLTQQAALIYPLLCGLHYLSPQKPWHLFIAFNCSVQGFSCSSTCSTLLKGIPSLWNQKPQTFPTPCSLKSHAFRHFHE